MGWNPVEGDKKIRSTPSFGGKVKPSITWLKILSHVKDYWGVWDTSSAKLTDMSRQVFSLLRYHVSLMLFARGLWWINQEWLQLVRWGHTIDHNIAAVHGTLCTIPPRNSNQWELRKFGYHGIIAVCGYFLCLKVENLLCYWDRLAFLVHVKRRRWMFCRSR
jgi:hypothetical protein